MTLGKDSLEKAALWAYIISVAFAPLGPVVHYIGWPLCIVFLLINYFKNGVSWKVTIPKDAKSSFYAVAALVLWTAVVGVFSIGSFSSYGRNLSVFLEVFIGIYLAMRTLNTEAARDKFIKILFYASVFIMAGNLLRYFGFIDFPNKTMENGNVLGSYSIGMLAFFAGFAYGEKKYGLVRFLPLVLAALLLVLSFSSGAWLAVFFGGVFLFIQAIRKKVISWKVLTNITLILAMGIACAEMISGGAISRRAEGEMGQMGQVVEIIQRGELTRMESYRLTSGRDMIWAKCLSFIEERPVTGWGGMRFRDRCEEKSAVDDAGYIAKYEVIYHPHNTYLYVSYIAGIPGLLLFLYFNLQMFIRAIRLSNWQIKDNMPWGIVLSFVLISVWAYGLTGDILVGRRDNSVLYWALFGILMILPSTFRKGK